MQREFRPNAQGEARNDAELLELGEPLLELDNAWRIVRVSRGFEALVGRPRAELLGRVPWALWPEGANTAASLWRELRRAAAERVPVEFEEHFPSPDRWMGIAAYPVPGGLACVFQDRSALKRAEQSREDVEREARLRAAEAEAVLASVADGVLVYDAEGRILRSNAAADAILGLDPREREMTLDERITRGRIEWLREDGRPVAAEELPVLRTVRSGEPHRGTVLRARRPDGERWVILSTAPLLVNGARVGAVATVEDITERRRSERALRESEERTRAVFANMNEGLALGEVIFDDDGVARDVRLLELNDAFERNFGLSREALQGRPVREVLPRIEQRWIDACSAVALGGEPRRLEEHDRAQDRYFSAYCFSPTPGRFAILFSDVTEPRRSEEALRESKERFRLLADAMPQIVCVIKPDGAPEYVNPRWAAYSGLDLDATLRAGWPGVLHPDDVAQAIACRRRALKSLEPQDVELRYRSAAGSYRWFLSRLAPVVEQGRVVRLVGSAMDIEDRKRAEAGLRLANERLREADRRKDEFLGMLSHELRNPLAPIRNALYILDHARPTEQQSRRATEVANRQVSHLTRLVDDLLDVTRIARGKVELRRGDVDLSVLARKTAEDYRPLVQSRGLALTVQLPGEAVVVNGDETRLSQVLGNLLSNAAKFTPCGGRVSLTVGALGVHAVVHVCDTGPGIAPEVLPFIFEPFSQAEQTLARSEGGLGLGLSLVRGLLALHGGEVNVACTGSAGTDFVVTLPIAKAQVSSPRAAAVSAVRPEAAPHHRVLVVDDNADAAETLAELVVMLGHEAQIAFDGPTAVAKARELAPDLVLCDIGLPGMDGYAVARQLRASGPSALRLVAVTGYAQPDDVTRAREAGFDEHVAKPPDPAQLAALLA